MPRIARNQLPPEGIYHVTARGVAGLPLYVDDVDRLDFMSSSKRHEEPRRSESTRIAS